MPDEYFITWLSSNIAALILLYFCWKYPKIGKYAYSVIFLLAAITNFKIATESPEPYLEYLEWTFLSVYERFIQGSFKENFGVFVKVIAFGQLLISLGLFVHSYLYKPALIGAMLFALAILPFGTGSGFPVPILMIISFWLLLKDKKYKSPESIIT